MPDWKPGSKHPPTVTVGGSNADFPGDTHLPIQAAVDYVSAHGGGTVRLAAGTFRMGNSVRLRSRVRLAGAGAETLLFKEPSVTVDLTGDTDWYDWHITVADPGPFRVGGGVALHGTCPHHGRPLFTKHTIMAIEGNTIRLDSQPRVNYWIGNDPKASTLFPIVTADHARDLEVANLSIHGNREHSAYLDGNHGGALFFQDCERILVDRVWVREIESDALSFQIVHDLTATECRFENAITGIHPGSGSQRPVMRNNVVNNCRTGLGWCWGVKHGIAQGNTFEDCEIGITIGHRDTDNIMRGNTVRNCSKHGFLVRADPPHQAAHRNLFEDNRVENVGTVEQPGYAIDITGPVDELILRRNRFRCTAAGTMKGGVRIGAEATRLVLDMNTFEGLPVDVADER